MWICRGCCRLKKDCIFSSSVLWWLGLWSILICPKQIQEHSTKQINTISKESISAARKTSFRNCISFLDQNSFVCAIHTPYVHVSFHPVGFQTSGSELIIAMERNKDIVVKKRSNKTRSSFSLSELVCALKTIICLYVYGQRRPMKQSVYTSEGRLQGHDQISGSLYIYI